MNQAFTGTSLRSRGRLLIVCLTALSMTAGAGSLQAAPAAVDQIEPGAGSWRTWVLESGSEIPVPPPPDRASTLAEIDQLRELASQRDAAALDQVQYWDAGAPSYRWNEIAVERAINNQPPVGLRTARGFALLNVAMYDAVIATWNAKYTHQRPRPSELDPSLSTMLPNAASPAYPSEHAAVAGAASAVLAYLAPEDAQAFADKAAAAGWSRVLAGVQYPSDVAAGLQLGQAVAARAIERAQGDGSDAVWSGTVPTGPGLWNGTNPREPVAGTWKPWALTSPSQVRPGPPPAFDSAEMAGDLAEVKNFARTPATNQIAFFWQNPQPGSFEVVYWHEQATRELFENRLDANPPRAARVYALESVALYDGLIACFDAKYAYWRIRPFQADAEITPLFPSVPNHPSYPSAEGCNGGAAAGVLGYLFPRDDELLKGRAAQAAESRLWAGIHFQSDIDAGFSVGRGVAQAVIAWASGDGSE
jgi:membrane-associated phospholipid phosphatase